MSTCIARAFGSAITCSCLLLQACGDRGLPNLPTAPLGVRSSGAFSDTADDAGGSPDDRPGPACTSIGARPTAADGGAASTGPFVAMQSPMDFQVTRVFSAWATCTRPEILVELSDGACPSGDQHKLQIYFSINAIDQGRVHVGRNPILPEPDSSGIRVRYRRPSSLPMPGTWGTCSGASGDVTLSNDIRVRHPGPLRATVNLSLSDCDGSQQPNVTVRGDFEIRLSRELPAGCPDV